MELRRGSQSNHMNIRKWTEVPKVSGVCGPEKLRDLEMVNECRKVLARMVNTLLDEVCQHQIHAAQQAFLKNRDILVNNIRMHSVYRDWIQEHPGEEGELLLLLLLDCTKRYNLLSWQWLERVLRASGLPDSLRQIILSLVPGEARLVLNGHEHGGVEFLAGTAQGCASSCFLSARPATRPRRDSRAVRARARDALH